MTKYVFPFIFLVKKWWNITLVLLRHQHFIIYFKNDLGISHKSIHVFMVLQLYLSHLHCANQQKLHKPVNFNEQGVGMSFPEVVKRCLRKLHNLRRASNSGKAVLSKGNWNKRQTVVNNSNYLKLYSMLSVIRTGCLYDSEISVVIICIMWLPWSRSSKVLDIS